MENLEIKNNPLFAIDGYCSGNIHLLWNKATIIYISTTEKDFFTCIAQFLLYAAIMCIQLACFDINFLNHSYNFKYNEYELHCFSPVNPPTLPLSFFDCFLSLIASGSFAMVLKFRLVPGAKFEEALSNHFEQ